MKMKLKMTSSELTALNKYLTLTLALHEIEYLRTEPVAYLICSVLKGLFDRTNAKVEDIRQLPHKTTDAIYSLSMTRSEALAFASSLPSEADYASVELTKGSYEEDVIRQLYGRIHQAYLI